MELLTQNLSQVDNTSKKKNNPHHLVVKLLKLSTHVRRKEMDIFCFVGCSEGWILVQAKTDIVLLTWKTYQSCLLNIPQTQNTKTQMSLESAYSFFCCIFYWLWLWSNYIQQDTILKKKSCIFDNVLTSYQLLFQDTIKQVQEELKSIDEADNLCVSFTNWIDSTQRSFAELTDSSEPQDRVALERKMKKLEVCIYLTWSMVVWWDELNFTDAVLNLLSSVMHLNMRCSAALDSPPWTGCDKHWRWVLPWPFDELAWLQWAMENLSTNWYEFNIKASKDILCKLIFCQPKYVPC